MQDNQEKQNITVTIEERLEDLECFLTVLFDDYFRDNPITSEDEQEATEEDHQPKQGTEKETKEETIEETLDRLECDLCFLYGEHLESQGKHICDDCMAEIFAPLTGENIIEARLSRLEDIAFILIDAHLEKARCLRKYLGDDDEHPCLFCSDFCDQLWMVESHLYTSRRNVKRLTLVADEEAGEA